MVRRFTVVWMLLWVMGIFAAPAAPENVLVDGYFFTLPPKWEWTPPADAAFARFIIPGNDERMLNDVPFYPMDGGKMDVQQRFAANFDKSFTLQQTSINIGPVEITYFDFKGNAITRAQ